jgi:hypothetical protein
MENKICGIDSVKIRKAFFQNKLPKLLIDIQASSEQTPEEYEKLSAYLEILKKEDDKLNSNFAKFLPSLETDEPDKVLDELNRESLSEAEIAELDKEKTNRDSAVREANRMLKGLFNKFRDKTQKAPSDDELMAMAFELLSLEYYLMRDSLYKERVFRKKIVDFERTGQQRKLAEEAAKTTITYREYALAEGLREMVKEFLNLTKKRYKNM